MSQEKPTPPDTDRLARKLQESLAKDRPRRWKFVIIAVVVSSILLLVGWWWKPSTPPEPLSALALDGVFTTEEMPQARAQLLQPGDEETRRHLLGHTVVFVELHLGQQKRQATAKSDEHGQAALDWPIAVGSTPAEFHARALNVFDRQTSALNAGQLYVWPKDTRLLIVDADETLIADQLDESASKTLKSAHAEGWRVVYLSPAGTQGDAFRMARGWIQQKQAKLPPGPVLGRPYYPSEDALEEARRIVLQSLQSRFKGAVVAVVKSESAAQTSKELGVRAVVIGAVGWADVLAQLK
jgi:hypothetical protein